MIDRAERDRLALLIESASAGMIEELELVEQLPGDSADRGVTEIADQAYWISPELARDDFREDLGRWVLFLRTEMEYEWPSETRTPCLILAAGTVGSLVLSACALFVFVSLAAAFIAMGLGILTTLSWLLLRARKQEEADRQTGDEDVWPFIRRSDYERALSARMPGHTHP